jgi:hypothetical protein
MQLVARSVEGSPRFTITQQYSSTRRQVLVMNIAGEMSLKAKIEQHNNNQLKRRKQSN